MVLIMELSSDAPSSSVPLLAQDTQEAFLTTPLSLSLFFFLNSEFNKDIAISVKEKQAKEHELISTMRKQPSKSRI